MAQDFAYGYVIIGGGIAGTSAARGIRGLDREGSILLLNDEDRLPYKRTKISKKMAAGFAHEDFALEPPEWYRENRVTLREGRAEGIDVSARQVLLSGGDTLSWKKLILANGAAPTLPPGIDVGSGDRVHVVRRASEVDRLRQAAASARRVVVVGNGVLGAEVAEQLRLMDKEVLLLGSSPRPLASRLNETLSGQVADLLSAHGIELRMNERVHAIDHRGSGIAVVTDDGEHEGDLVVFCTGVRPETGLAKSAGVAVAHGVLVDEHLLTSHDDVYAAGDLAEHPNGRVTFLWHAAELQGEIAGVNAAGGSRTHDCPPFRMKLEVFGDYYFSINPPISEEGLDVLEEREGRSYRCLYFRENALTGAVMANDKERAKQYVTAVREGWSEEMVKSRLALARGTGASL